MQGVRGRRHLHPRPSEVAMQGVWITAGFTGLSRRGSGLPAACMDGAFARSDCVSRPLAHEHNCGDAGCAGGKRALRHRPAVDLDAAGGRVELRARGALRRTGAGPRLLAARAAARAGRAGPTRRRLAHVRRPAGSAGEPVDHWAPCLVTCVFTSTSDIGPPQLHSEVLFPKLRQITHLNKAPNAPANRRVLQQSLERNTK